MRTTAMLARTSALNWRTVLGSVRRRHSNISLARCGKVSMANSRPHASVSEGCCRDLSAPPTDPSGTLCTPSTMYACANRRWCAATPRRSRRNAMSVRRRAVKQSARCTHLTRVLRIDDRVVQQRHGVQSPRSATRSCVDAAAREGAGWSPSVRLKTAAAAVRSQPSLSRCPVAWP